MNRKALLIYALSVSLVAPALVSAAEPDVNGWAPVPLVEDSAVTAAIKTKLADGQWSNLAQLKVGTDREGTVWLDATKTQEAADRVVEMARATDGVVQVRSHIVVHRDSK
jgi:hypothetical protein